MMTSDRTIREGLVDLLKQHQERLVRIALAKLHLPANYRYQPDFYQEGCLAYAQAYVTFPGPPDADRDHFYAYAYRRIHWRLLDCYRATLTQVETRECASTDPSTGQPWLVNQADPRADHQFRAVELHHDWAAARAQLTPRQRRYLTLTQHGWTNAEIAQAMGISRTTVYELRRRALAALRQQLDK